MALILALDQGTTSSRALLVNEAGDIVASAQQEFKQHFPQQGWVEHDANEIWKSQKTVAEQALRDAGVNPTDVAAIGVTNQRETTVVWDRKTGEPLSHAIVWQDRRTAPLCQELKDKALEPLFQKKTGLLLDPYFSGTKLKWILDNVPEARIRAEKGELAFGTVDSWLVWKLTDGNTHITDVTNASRTLLCNIHTGEWDPELMQLLDIPEALMPQIVPSSGVVGETSLFGGTIPIAGIAGDQQAALFGQGCHTAGQGKVTYGTGAFILLHTGTDAVASKNRLLTTCACTLDGSLQYALEGSVFNAGTVIQWLRFIERRGHYCEPPLFFASIHARKSSREKRTKRPIFIEGRPPSFARDQSVRSLIPSNLAV